MKRVWKCDFCYHIDISKEKMTEHENSCSSNPIFKKCWSCNFHEPSPYDSGFYCKNKNVDHLDVYDYEDNGNCPEWITDNEKLLRKIKIRNINKLI